MYERYLVIHLHLIGNTYQHISSILKRLEKTIGTYIHSYKQHGLDGLTIPINRRAARTIETTIINSVPHEVGYTAKFNWTLEIIASYIKREFGHSYSIRGVSKMMHRLGLSYTNPTFTLAARRRRKAKRFCQKYLPRGKKYNNGEIDHILDRH